MICGEPREHRRRVKTKEQNEPGEPERGQEEDLTLWG